MTKELDPITLQVVGGALHSIAEQMGNVLYRMSYSSIIRESQDLGAGLFDTEYNTLCESDSTPMHIGSLPGYLRGIEQTVKLEDWKPGDCVIHNHPYKGASHSPDIAIVMPVFVNDELVGFSANTAHHVDIGAATPGLIIDVPDVWAEGMLLDGVKLYNEGVRNEDLWKYIRDNTLPGTPSHEVLIQVSKADHQVTNLGAHIMARTIGGVVNLAPTIRDVWGLDVVEREHSGSAMIEIDFGNPDAPITNIPHWADEGPDPHGRATELIGIGEVLRQFYDTGVAENPCNGSCDEDDIL